MTARPKGYTAPTGRRRGVAAALALALPAVCLLFWVSLIGARPPGPPAQTTAAAIAVRDNVSTFEKWGTHWFTQPYLARSYAQVTYVTAHTGSPKHGELRDAVTEALAHHDAVDLFILAHSNSYYGLLRDLPVEDRQKLRLVYNTGCSDAWQASVWLDLGADTYVGHPGDSASPVFYFYFLRSWLGGDTISAATARGNERMHRTLGVAQAANPFEIDLRQVGEMTHAGVSGRRDVTIP
jgi:hypothetical protein